jgi:predicted acylesterase/phospholipase RssA
VKHIISPNDSSSLLNAGKPYMPNIAPRLSQNRQYCSVDVLNTTRIGMRALVMLLVVLLGSGCATVHTVTSAVERRPAHVAHTPTTVSSYGLCLSGGGYRAMLFHAGVALRLYEVQRLQSFNSLSGVSGGAITAAWLGLRWNDLFVAGEPETQRFNRLIIEPLRSLARETIDIPAIAKGVLLPGSASGYLADALDQHLFRGATLADLPEPKVEGGRLTTPVVILNATNMLTGRPWVFTRDTMSEYRRNSAGPVLKQPDLKLAVAVAASTAFPPFLAPVRLDVSKLERTMPIAVLGPEIEGSSKEPYVRMKLAQLERIEREYFELIQNNIPLVDGGVGGNLGLELCAIGTVRAFVSSAIALGVPGLEVGDDWISVSRAVMELIYARAESKDADVIRQRNTVMYLYQSADSMDQMQRTMNETPMYAPLSDSGETFRDWALFRQVQFASLSKNNGEAYLSDLVGKTPGQARLGLASLRALANNHRDAVMLASVPTRLETLDECIQEHLINWGYVLADMVMDVRQNWRAFRKENYEMVRQERYEELDEKVEFLGTMPRFELPFKLHPALQTLSYAAIETGETPPLQSRCTQSPTFVIPPKQ